MFKMGCEGVFADNQNLIPAVLDCSLCGSQTGDGNAEGRAGHVVQADLVAERTKGGKANEINF